MEREKSEKPGVNPWEMMAAEERLSTARRHVQSAYEYNLSAKQHQQTLDAVAEMEQRYERQLTDGELLAIIKPEPNFYGMAHKLDPNGFPANADGKVLEKGITQMIIEQFGYVDKKDGVFSRHERDMSTREANIAEDVLEGADVMVNRLPVDITLNPEKGGKIGSVDADGGVVDGFATIGDIDGVIIRSGFRMTNGRHELPMPVCVILFEGARERLFPGDIVEKMRRNPLDFKRLTDDAMSAYWDYADAMEAA